MTRRMGIGVLLVGLAVLLAGCRGMHKEEPGMMAGQGGMMGQKGMMGQQEMMGPKGMMSGDQMQDLMARHHEAMQALDQLKADLTALRTQDNLAAVHKRLAEDVELLAGIESRMQMSAKMMDQMSEHMLNCPGMGEGNGQDRRGKP